MAMGTRRMNPATEAITELNDLARRWQPSAAPAHPPAPVQRGAALYLFLAASLGGGTLLWACFHPVALGAYLGWFALTPFLLLVRARIPAKLAYLFAGLTGICFFVPALHWMRVADDMMYAAWPALSVYCALFFPAALFCLRRLERWHVPMIVSAPAVWVGFEWLRCWLLTGFPWYLLAHTQHDTLPMIQIADIGGVFLVSFVVVAVNAFIFDCAWQFPEIRQWFAQTELEPYRYYASIDVFNRSVFAEWLFRRNLLLEGGALVLVLAATFAYGKYRMQQDRFQDGPIVCMLQSNLDQRLRDNTARPETDGHSLRTVTEHFRDLCNRAALNHAPAPDLLIWPETSFPSQWYQMSVKLHDEPEEPAGKKPRNWREWRDAEIQMRDRFRELAGFTGVPHLVGINGNDLEANGKWRKSNTALLIDRHGEIDGRFDKIHRVPFGEYVPFIDWLPFMKVFSAYDYDFSVKPGEHLTRFKLNKYHFGVLICYEDSDPFMARQYLSESSDGPPIDFLVNISNDGWFDGSCEHEEHLAVSRFRAIECRRAMVRAVNMGVSAVIDGNGRVLKPTRHDGKPPVWVVQTDEFQDRVLDFAPSDWHTMKQTMGVLKATVPIDTRVSFYALAGDWLPIGCWTGIVGAAAWAMWRRRRSPQPA
ncbi:MAG TPA: apolipoprotein N-acyltransferase [Gemmataceae bacterium]|nr:apolipoprotein N-acyltransferase [Gemmataceae bacterium]